MLTRVLIFACSLSWTVSLFAQQPPFSTGVNLTNWFQAGNVRQIQPNRYTLTDFQQIQSLGCDVIRLPINLHFMTNGAPDYVVDPLLFDFLDPVIDWADSLNMHLIIDNHTFDPAVNTNPNVGTILEKVWPQIAAYYADGYDHLYYEILNEPHGISDAAWGAIQQGVIDKIRMVDTTHSIIVGGANWNSYTTLDNLPLYQDDNLIYTFHFYDPFVFTHQGASWTTPSMAALTNIPFPYRAADMPAFPAALNGTWVQSAFNNYQQEGSVAAMNQAFDVVDAFRTSRNVPVFCGEFGAYAPNCAPDDRVQYYAALRQILDTRNIAWTMWDYQGGFGLFQQGTSQLFNHHLDTALVAALGFMVPPQTPFQIQPDTAGLMIYDDALAQGIIEGSVSSSGIIDYYAPDYPNSGTYTLKWEGPSQYESLGFDFSPDKDFSQLVTGGYALDLMIRGDQPQMAVDIRFLDTKTSPSDRPWRMRVSIDQQLVSWDKTWHHLHLPLSNFVEHGSWDDNTWHNPQGLFDWSAIDKLEIVAEQQSLSGATLWLDQIWLTNQDTAVIREERALSIETGIPAPSLLVYPNPAQNMVELIPAIPGQIEVSILDLQGKLVEQHLVNSPTILDIQEWADGLYFIQSSGKESLPSTIKFLKR